MIFPAEEQDVLLVGEKKKGEEKEMNDETFGVLLNLLMVSDPWPLEEREHTVLLAYADEEAQRRGLADWIEAYHGKVGEQHGRIYSGAG